MNDSTPSPNFFTTIISDDGVQRAAAGVVVSVVVAVAKNLIFSKAS